MESMVNIMFEQDYIIRLIQQMVRTILKLLFNMDKKEDMIIFEDEKTEQIYNQLLELVNQGMINEAENMLYEQLDTNNTAELKMGLLFYEYLNELSDETLEQCDYKREEIRMGIQIILKEYGYLGLTDMFLPQ